MYFLNLTTVKKSISLLLCLTLFACSSTEQFSSIELSENSYTQDYVSTNFPHSQFTPTSKDGVKKSLHSDHQLMRSLLNRPMTADQAMMLAFVQERVNYADAFAHNASHFVIIKGDKASDSSSHRTMHAYAQQINQDINAVTISAP